MLDWLIASTPIPVPNWLLVLFAASSALQILHYGLDGLAALIRLLTKLLS